MRATAFRAVPERLRRPAADDLARPRVHEPDRQTGDRDRRRLAQRLFRQLRVLRATACSQREAAAGAVRAPAGDAGEGDQVHRAVQGYLFEDPAGAVAGEDAGEDGTGHGDGHRSAVLQP